MRSIVETLPGARLLEAPDGALGLELARGHQPDLIVLDIALPDMDGYGLLKRLRAASETAGIPVIALSASAMPADIERGLQAGFLRYLTKPVKMRELFAVISEMAQRRSRG
jgi:CheY-like chemotaxis protein